MNLEELIRQCGWNFMALQHSPKMPAAWLATAREDEDAVKKSVSTPYCIGTGATPEEAVRDLLSELAKKKNEKVAQA